MLGEVRSGLEVLGLGWFVSVKVGKCWGWEEVGYIGVGIVWKCWSWEVSGLECVRVRKCWGWEGL